MGEELLQWRDETRTIVGNLGVVGNAPVGMFGGGHRRRLKVFGVSRLACCARLSPHYAQPSARPATPPSFNSLAFPAPFSDTLIYPDFVSKKLRAGQELYPGTGRETKFYG